MKQQGKIWIDHEGQQTPAARVSVQEKMEETFGQRIAAEATTIFNRINAARESFIDMCEQILQRSNHENKTDAKNIVFYTFDHSFKINYDSERKEIHVSRATKAKPGHKDFDKIILDMNPPLRLKAALRQEVDIPVVKDDKLAQAIADLKLPTSNSDDVNFSKALDKAVDTVKAMQAEEATIEDPDKTKQPNGSMSEFEKSIRKAVAEDRDEPTKGMLPDTSEFDKIQPLPEPIQEELFQLPDELAPEAQERMTELSKEYNKGDGPTDDKDNDPEEIAYRNAQKIDE